MYLNESVFEMLILIMLDVEKKRMGKRKMFKPGKWLSEKGF